ncbi:putative adhesin [Micromonospora sp. SD12]|uniref:putative adhesin n=1 Tax=Micromonospora sp. SD12 TaxID=3452216 RepID=UPI003F88C207
MASDAGSTWWSGVQAAADGDIEGVARAGTKNGLAILSFAGPAKGVKMSRSARADSASAPVPPRRVVEGGRPDGETVFAGHAKHELSNGNVKVPEGTRVAVYAPYSKTLDDAQGFAVESGSPWMNPVRTYKSGESMPNFTLMPPSGLRIRANSVTVSGPTLLADLLGPNMGTCHWAACSVTAR